MGIMWRFVVQAGTLIFGGPCGRALLGALSAAILFVPLSGLGARALADSPAALPFVPLGSGDVTVGGEIGRRVDITIRGNLLALNVDKDFLEPFRKKSATGGYIGLGKLIDSTVSFAAYSHDEKVLALKKHLVDETIKSQLADGYIGTFRPERRVRTLWDLHEMVYVIFGLVSDYRHFGDKASLDAARKLGDYIMKSRPATAPPRDVGKLNTERAFLALSAATGDKKYLDYAVESGNLRHWQGKVGGHAYTFMNDCLAQLDLNEVDPDPALVGQSHRVFDFLTAHDGLVVDGTCSMNEGFHDNQDGRNNLGETCATAYLIRLSDHLMQLEGNSLYGDVMERAIYNALFAAQSPDGRRLRYFTCFEGKRVYFNTDTYCCPCNFRRIVAELPGMIYFRADGGVAVNLYAASTAKVALSDGLSVGLRQETDYPNSGKVVLHVDPSRPAEFELKLRIPRWCDKATISVNDRPIEGQIKSGSFHAVKRQWSAGDRVVLDMPMPWRIVRGRKMQAGRVAVLRGPQLFCLNPARQSKPMDAATAAGLRLDTSTFELVKDDKIRPDGLACRVRAWSPKQPASQPADLELLLTEFADPGGEHTYFLAGSVADDELAAKTPGR